MPPTLRFLEEFLYPGRGRVVREETTYRRGGDRLPATLYRPGPGWSGDGRPPGWMTLHGLTSRGREHPSLDRFARSLAASGAVVLVPDLPEWRRLEVAPDTTVATVRAAILELDRRELAEPGRIGAIGFSFGATQTLIAATDPALAGHLAGVAAWGGYLDFHRAVRYGFVGAHDLDDQRYERTPDPYGRWILAGNYITLLPEHAGDGPLAQAFLSLAREAGRRGIMSWDPATDPLKKEAKRTLDDRQAGIFDLLAHPADHRWTAAERARVEELARRLSLAALEHDPGLDPRPYLDRLPVPVFLAHGRDDRLLPWTELVRLRRAIPAHRLRAAEVTGLFSHSFGERRLPSPGLVLEAIRFVRLVRRMLRLI